MLMIGDVLISDEVVKEQFLCNLNACKGACCWEGESGAPLDEEELAILDRIYEDVKPFLLPEGRAAIAEHGPYVYYEDHEEFGTTLVDSGACAFMTYDNEGIAKCGMEQAWRAGATDFRKPVSCHLYPLRALPQGPTGLQALDYEHWEICSAACELGKAQQLPVYQFAKAAIVRKYGADFYEQLHAAAQDLPDFQ